MNAIALAKTAYSAPGQPTRTNRSTEYELFARITRRLVAAQSATVSDIQVLANALHENRQLWTTLAIDVADPENRLPQDLRARIFFLAEFTSRHTSKILSGYADSTVLIEINTAIMRGLRQDGGGA
ncbi:flagellar biosynthesis regulator FlhF [Rhodobacter veldkampii DSM 11550]|uniref:flagellar biosynthesis regulator FlaF n=1 Tax=Phaeovulum veldkampii TaxID=33049 RepID=UPI001061234E|nr:flagellar biosynthesis regulator FlaF [Phaeovulum veldkampii]MBK5946555.1 flagellar biosynthesis regulator FlhF [Phaeovulum veldkampii DSM 11550]TDQ60034.1 flagellar protein FlaF [Phaeovulum veldkampii DSM 11550]